MLPVAASFGTEWVDGKRAEGVIGGRGGIWGIGGTVDGTQWTRPENKTRPSFLGAGFHKQRELRDRWQDGTLDANLHLYVNDAGDSDGYIGRMRDFAAGFSNFDFSAVRPPPWSPL